MFFIPGILISIVTFPGVIVHEMAHQFFCRIFNVAILDVCYFRFGNPVGYVVHEIPKKAIHSIMIGVGPFFVNTIIGALIALPSIIPVIKFESGSPLDYFLIWLGVSIAMHSFPSIGDAKSIWEAVWNDETSLRTRIVALPIVALIFIGSIGSFFWLDLIYGIGVIMLVPYVLVKLFA